MDDAKSLEILMQIKDDIADIKTELAGYVEKQRSLSKELAEVQEAVKELKSEVAKLKNLDVVKSANKWNKITQTGLAICAGALIAKLTGFMSSVLDRLLGNA